MRCSSAEVKGDQMKEKTNYMSNSEDDKLAHKKYLGELYQCQLEAKERRALTEEIVSFRASIRRKEGLPDRVYKKRVQLLERNHNYFAEQLKLLRKYRGDLKEFHDYTIRKGA